MSTVSRTSAVLGRRACALVAAGSAVLHMSMVGHAGSPMAAVIVIAMTAACLTCAYDLWRAGSQRVWCLVAVMNLAMIGIHMSGPVHHHGSGVPVVQVPTVTPLMTVATAVALAEALVAALMLCVYAWRQRAQTALLVGLDS